MLSVATLLVCVALLLSIASAIGKCPVWVPVFLLAVVGLLERWPR